MGEPSFFCQPPPEGCCLSLPETIAILVALIIVVQLALKLASVLFYYLWYLVGIMFGMVVVQGPQKPKLATSKAKRLSSAAKSKASLCWSDESVPRRRRRKESSSPSPRCLHCTLEPLKVTMNLQNKDVPYRVGRHPYSDYPPYLPPHYYECECASRPRPQPRPRRASAPSTYAIARFRDAISGSSDPILGPSGGKTPERRSMATGTELVLRKHAGEAQYRPKGTGPDAEHPGSASRSRRPAKVYIYPVHPQTPPGSRSSSPERPRRRHHRRRAITTSQEEQQEPERRAPRRKSREAGQQTSPPTSLHYRVGSTNLTQEQVPTEPRVGKPRYYWSDQVSGADWVYQPVK